MGALVPITAKAVTTQGFQLQTAQDMLDAFTYLSGLALPYTGSMNVGVVDGVMTWWMTLVGPHGTGTTGYIGDYIILENSVSATICRQVDFDTFYALA